MKSNTSVYIIVALIVVLIGYFSFFSGEKKKKKVESKKLSLLLGGGGSESENGFEKRRGHKNNDASVFDGEFMKTGVSFPEEEANSNVASEQGEIPINPQTGKPWEEDAMQQFEELRKQFVDNDLIPRRMTRLEKDRQAQLQDKWNKAQNAVNSGTFTRDDLDTHFSHQKKVVEDRLQIIEHLIESQKEDGDVDKDGQFQKILDGTKEQMKQLETQKEELLKKLG
ncbi:MAG: hypothetical protein IPL26_01535 [Leptospiraceae bacterium]|nr:hypothetical protein [Leptospiraceae bacterium]